MAMTKPRKAAPSQQSHDRLNSSGKHVFLHMMEPVRNEKVITQHVVVP